MWVLITHGTPYTQQNTVILWWLQENLEIVSVISSSYLKMKWNCRMAQQADLWCPAAQKPAHLWSSRTAPVPGKRRAQKQSKSLRRRRSRPWVRNTQILSFHVHCSLLMHSMKPDLLSSQRMQKSADGRKRSLLAWGFCTWPVCKPKLAS